MGPTTTQPAAAPATTTATQNYSTKVRFDGLDVTAMVTHLQQTCLGQRVVNIYDGDSMQESSSGSGGTYLIKLEKNKQFLLLESGIRFHIVSTTQNRGGASSAGTNTAASSMPTPFCAKLRKHLRGLRLEQVMQLGNYDRVVLFLFGVGEQRQALILELYSKGNLILTDHLFTVQALLRSHVYADTTTTTTTPAATTETTDNKSNNNGTNNQSTKKGGGKDSAVVQVQVGHVYPVTYATSSTSNKQEGDDPAAEGILAMQTPEQVLQWIQEAIQEKLSGPGNSGTEATTSKKKKNAGSFNLKMLLLQPKSGVSHYGPALLEHCILVANLKPHAPLQQQQSDNHNPFSTEQCQALLTSLKDEGTRIMNALRGEGREAAKGYILYKPKELPATKTNDENETTAETPSPIVPELPHANKILLDFQPQLLQQHANSLVLEYENFAAAVEDFFAHISTQKIALKAQSAEKNALKKLEKVRHDQAARLKTLELEQVLLQQQATAVQQHADDVEKVLVVINSALDSGMDWEQLQELVTMEQEQKQNPIALLIHKLELEQDVVILKLPAVPDPLLVPISLKESAHANANRLFAKYRASKEKAQKTIDANTKALKAAEETALRQLEEAQKRSKIVTSFTRRKQFWFERFHWFITSDNYLVLAGKDAHQNELLVKRYLRPGDAYLHADVFGAASCIVRAKRQRSAKTGKTESIPLSERALQEAGNFTCCHSSAWSKKMVISAWWVEAHQVSKTAPTGEYLTVGSFMVRGKKNFLPPCTLEMGLGVLFVLGDDPDSIARHAKERRDFALMELEEPNDDVFKDDDNDPDDNQKGDDDLEDNLQDDTKSPLDDEQLDMIDDGKTDEVADNAVDSGKQGLVDLEVDQNKDVEENDDQASESDDSDDDNKASLEQQQAQPQEQKKGGLSKKDRRLIKKYGSLEAAKGVLAARGGSNKAENDNGVASQKPEASTGANDKSKRGKKAKLKKVMKKYADQDDEDRQLAMQALQGGEKKAKKKGSNKHDKKVSSEIQEQAAAETVALLVKDSSAVAQKLPEAVLSLLAQSISTAQDDAGEGQVRWEKFDAGTLEQLVSLSSEAQLAAATRLLTLKQSTRIDNFSASLGGIIRTIHKYGHEKLNSESRDPADAVKRKTKAEKDAEALKWKQTMVDEGIPLVEGDADDDAVDDSIELGKLTGKPHPDDMLLFAVPVCAPYQTISQYTYRVKLTPGSVKRGKAAKQCVELLLRDDNNKTTSNHARYKEFIKRVPDNDWMQTMCSDVKITAAGVSKAVKKGNATTQKAKKAKNKK